MQEQYTLEEWMSMLQEAGYELEEGKLSRLAAGLGIGALGATAGRMTAPTEKPTPVSYSEVEPGYESLPDMPTDNDSVVTTNRPDLTQASRAADSVLNAKGINPMRVNHTWGAHQNPDGTWTATIDARKQSNLPEAYTLEEWMSMLEEAVYSVEEGNAENKAKKKEYIIRIGRAHGDNDRGIDTPSKAAGQTDSEATHSGRKEVRTTNRAISNLEADASLERAIRKLKNNPHFTLDEWMSMIQEAGASDDERAEIVKRLNAAMAAKGGTGSMKAVVDAARELAAHRKKVKRTQPTSEGTSTNEEQYTLEEWIGMLEEAGYDVSEYSLWRPKESGAKASGVIKDPKKPKQPSEPRKPKSSRKPNKSWETEEDWRGLHGLTPDEDPRPDLRENNKSTISENTVARLQGLAGIKPLNG